MSPNREESRDINQLIGVRVRAARNKAGLTQQELAEMLGTSYNKVHNIELGVTQARVTDLLQVATALDVSPWVLLQDAVEPPDLESYLWIRYQDVAIETGNVVQEMTSLLRWVERRHKIKLRMTYRPMYYQGLVFRVIEFDEAWGNPVLGDDKKVVYIERSREKISGYFFPMEIVPSSSPDRADTPMCSDTHNWESEEALAQFLKENGYCLWLYPERIHLDEYCSPEHRVEIDAQSSLLDA
jgi:transcriptional regulator with XRE-family HTH domain